MTRLSASIRALALALVLTGTASAQDRTALDVDGHRKFVEVLGHRMAYLEAGTGDPIVLLHGNGTTSYLWRKIIPYLQDHGRVIAPDLIGLGHSDRLPASLGPDRYRVKEHIRYIHALLKELGVRENVILVAHDWGGPILFDWARRHPDAVQGIAYMETLLLPFTAENIPPGVKPFFQMARTPQYEQMVMHSDQMLDRIVMDMRRFLTEEGIEVYTAMRHEGPEARRPLVTFPREAPLDGQPADVAALLERNWTWLRGSQHPKLLVTAEPGVIVRGKILAAARTLENQSEIRVLGEHMLQEWAPQAIGSGLATWVGRVRKAGASAGER